MSPAERHLITFGLALAGLLSPAPVPAATDLEGDLAADARWTAQGSPYRLTGDLLVPAGVTLTIDPGVTVLVAAADRRGAGADPARVELVVRGALVAHGTAERPVVLRAEAGGSARWAGLSLEVEAGPSALRNVILSEAQTALLVRAGAPLALEHLTLLRVGTGIDWRSGRPLALDDSVLQGGEVGVVVRSGARATLTRVAIDWMTGDALAAEADDRGAPAIQVLDSSFRSNGTGLRLGDRAAAAVLRSYFAFNATGLAAEPGASLQVRGCLVVGSAAAGLDLAQAGSGELEVVDSTFERNGAPGAGAGLRVRSLASPLRLTLRGNLFSHNGVGVRLNGLVWPALAGNTFRGNHLDRAASGAGAVAALR